MVIVKLETQLGNKIDLETLIKLETHFQVNKWDACIWKGQLERTWSCKVLSWKVRTKLERMKLESSG